jgi:hypothetical protein
MGHELLIFSWFKVGLVVSDKRVCEEEVPVISDRRVVMTKEFNYNVFAPGDQVIAAGFLQKEF